MATVVCLATAVVFFCGGGARADFHFGAKGIAASSIVEDNERDAFRRNDCVSAFSGGLFAVIHISDDWAIQPEIRYVRKGDTRSYVYRGSGVYYQAEITSCLDYIEVPLLVRYAFGVADNARPYLIAGPFAEYRFSAKEKISNYQYPAEWPDRREYDVNIEIGDVEAGFVLGTGIEVRSALATVVLEGRYTQSLNETEIKEKVTGDSIAKRATLRTFSFEVGILPW